MRHLCSCGFHFKRWVSQWPSQRTGFAECSLSAECSLQLCLNDKGIRCALWFMELFNNNRFMVLGAPINVQTICNMHCFTLVIICSLSNPERILHVLVRIMTVNALSNFTSVVIFPTTIANRIYSWQNQCRIALRWEVIALHNQFSPRLIYQAQNYIPSQMNSNRSKHVIKHTASSQTTKNYTFIC